VGGLAEVLWNSLLDQHLGDECVENFRQLSRIFSSTTQHSIDETELATLEELTADFVRNYERLYYRGEPRRLPVCLVNIHYLVHLVAHIRDCGPLRYCWQFPMERYCGIIKLMFRSKSRLNTSLAYGVTLLGLDTATPPSLVPHPFCSCHTPDVLFMISAATFGLPKNIHVIFSYDSEMQEDDSW